MRSLTPTINGNVGTIGETNPLDLTCRITGCRHRATLHWTIGQKDFTSNATEWFSHNTPSDTHTVISDFTNRVGKYQHGQDLRCKAANVVVPIGLQITITLNVTCKLNTVRFSNKWI